MPTGNYPAAASTTITNPDGSITVTSTDGNQKFIVSMNGNSINWQYGVYINTPPVPTFEGFTTDASLTMNYHGNLTATDSESDALTYSLVTPPSTGSLVVQPNGSFAYTGSVMPGTYSFTYTVTDGNSAPVAKTATITINDVAPIAGGAFASLVDMTVSDNS